MIKLRTITISGFRGARFEIPIDFGNGHRSLAVYGENASGKSTIADALEWFVLNRVGHLWREDCREDALRNVFRPSNEDTVVSVKFSNSLENSKSLSGDLSITNSSGDPKLADLLARLKFENIFLRHAQIAEFIQKSKSEKRKAVASIIGYDEISDFRNTIQSTRNSLEKDQQYISAKDRADRARKRLIELAGAIITSPAMLYERMNSDLEQAGFSFRINDRDSFFEAIQRLLQDLKKDERIEKRLTLSRFQQGIEDFVSAASALRQRIAELREYNLLVEEHSALGQLNLYEFLNLGTQLIDHGHAQEDQCPFCLSAYNATRLRETLNSRVAAIRHVKTRLDNCVASVERAVVAASAVEASCNEICKLSLDAGATQFQVRLASLRGALAAFRAEAALKLRQRESIVFREQTLLTTEAQEALSVSAQYVELVRSLEFTAHEARVIELVERLRELRQTFYHFDKDGRSVAAFEKQILALGTIFESFVQTQNAALQNVLDKISGEVGKFYSALHPEESVDNVRLRIVGEEGVEFQYGFHGEPTYPPMKYLSESHLNSLGVVLFLASAKLFNRESRILVLDDIVTSFDQSHRRRLLRLLKQEFSDWQIILLTHEAFWFDMMKRELVPSGWQAIEVRSDDENGALIEPSAKDMQELISRKRQQFDVSNDLRKLLEATLKEVIYHLEAKVAFRFNDQNERRMNGELLSELRSTVNRKCASLKSSPIFSDLEGSNLVVTIGSHDNPEAITGGDIDVALSDIAALNNLFVCSSCNRHVSAAMPVPGKNMISCRCGGKQLDWR